MRLIRTVGKYIVDIMVDDEDYARLSRYKWYFSTKKGYAYRIERLGDRKHNIRMHREILTTELLVDHIDLNKFNNQKKNLRPATRAQNAQNTGVKKCYARKNKSSQFKGVSKRRGAWRMNIKLPDGTLIDKRYETEVEAAREYDRLARIHFKEFAKTNFPD